MQLVRMQNLAKSPTAISIFEVIKLTLLIHQVEVNKLNIEQ